MTPTFRRVRKIYGITHDPMEDIDCLSQEEKTEYIPPAQDIDKVIMACSGQDRGYYSVITTPLQGSWDFLLGLGGQ